MKNMSRHWSLLWLLPTLMSLTLVQAAEVNKLQPVASEQMAKIAMIVTGIVERYHYKKVPLNNALSAKVLARYLDMLDPNRSFFLQSDINSFAVYKNSLDDFLHKGKIQPAFTMFNVYRERVQERVSYALSLLKSDFDFTKNETYVFDRSKEPWLTSTKEMNENWRKRVKNDFLSLRLADKKDSDIRDTLIKRYQGLERRINQFDAEDIFQTFINAYTLSIEPHTGYMSPSTSENFDISMRLSLEGIGAVLRSDNEFTVVQSVVEGGPAELSGQIHTGDKIVGVAQGLDGKMEDIVGWRLQDVVDKIRGPKGSVVRLEVIPHGLTGAVKHKLVTIVRNQIKLEDQAARKLVIQNLEGMGKTKIGVIIIPGFYRDFRGESSGDRNFRSTTRDVERLLDELKSEGVDGIVIDLRDNGGGSLSEATSLTGLFVGRGPVVQVKDSFGKTEVERASDRTVAYAGPLAILVDSNSASASEIFAGAIQDYKRGIIIGEPTFGKGTVQTLVDLNRFSPGAGNMGKLRLTMAQFFRVNGASTQNRGVIPDIAFSFSHYSKDQRESSLDNALPWAKIAPARYKIKNDVNPKLYPRLRALSEERTKKDVGFVMLDHQRQWLKILENNKMLTLNEKQRRAISGEQEKSLKEERRQYLQSVGIKNPKPQDEEDPDSVVNEDERKAISQIQLNEAARILTDLITVTAK
ncbi:peptidase S41 [Achromatium sp. WMS2]|nr:peptidase S41 [Achromatium sp. WMS2]